MNFDNWCTFVILEIVIFHVECSVLRRSLSNSGPWIVRVGRGKFKKKTNSVFDCIDGSPCPCGMICVVQARSSGVSEKTGSGNDVTGNRRSGSNAGSGRDTFSCVHKYRWNSYANTAVILSRQPVDLYRQSVFLYSWNTDVINVLCEKQSKNVFINVLIFPRFY